MVYDLVYSSTIATHTFIQFGGEVTLEKSYLALAHM